MQVATQYRYNLDKSSKKFHCPQCRQKRFVRVIDTETQDYLPDHVGRCDRESGCGYEYKWSEWLKEQGTDIKPFIEVKPIEQPKPIDYLPLELLGKTTRHYNRNNLFSFFSKLFTQPVALDVFKRYLIGTSTYWNGATIYWQIDKDAKVRQCKIMLYHPETGKRVKAGAPVQRYNRKEKMFITEIAADDCSKIYGKYLTDYTKDLNLEQTFFGAHLLAEFPNKPVCITESEKTALICSVYMPDFIWLATGGASGCRWKEYNTYKILTNRTVTFFPDYGWFNKKTEKTCYQEWCDRVERIKDVIPGKIRVSNLVETRLVNIERADQDLADLLIVRDGKTGIALTDAGYPVNWDYQPNAI